MPYLSPQNKEKENQLTKNNNNNNNKNNNNNDNNSINHNNKNISILTTTTTSKITTTISKTLSPISNSIHDNNSKTIPSIFTPSSLHTIPSSYDTSSNSDFFKHYIDNFPSTVVRPPASQRRKSAPEILKPLSIPQKNFIKNDINQLVTIKKKSGEVVRPSLKKRAKSEPNTPVLLMPKYVHFNADLEQVRLFNGDQKPQAASADVTSDESDDDDDDDDFVFSCDDDDDSYIDPQEPELTISIPNMPLITISHSSKPVFVESIFLSKNKRKLEGRIMVQNIAFHKLVEVRYTFDFWQSVSEVKATYAEGMIEKENKKSYDLFVFSIELFDNSRNPIDNKTMYFAVHYNVNNRDYWDNNSGSNYQVKFKKSSQCNHNCQIDCKSLSSSSSSSLSLSSSSSPWRIIPSKPENNRPKVLSNDCHSPPAASSITHNSIIDSRKKGVASRYDIGLSLSAAQNIPRSSFNNNNYNNNKINNSSNYYSSMTTNTQTQAFYYHIPTLAITCDAYKSFSSGNYIDGMPVTTEAPLSSSMHWGDGSPKRNFSGFPLISSNPIEIPNTGSSINSTNSYYDQIISQYCFSSGSAVPSSSPYASSPSIIH